MAVLVGITCGFDEDENKYYLRPGYLDSVVRAGGTPVILPAVDSPEMVNHYLQVCDAYVLSGGDDIDPAYWGENPEPGLGYIDPPRDKFETALARGIVELDKPALCICRGIQVLNVALGGDLFQDLQSELSHRQKAPRYHPFHDVLVEKDGLLYGILQGDIIRVNSFHHQAVRNLAPGLAVTARARDGVVEAVEHRGKSWIVGVQWHPETMRDASSACLFLALVKAAARDKSARESRSRPG